jgi:hypothetical protein
MSETAITPETHGGSRIASSLLHLAGVQVDGVTEHPEGVETDAE